ncbi:phosphatase PAP2 family protein [Paenibacillus sp. N1-5-1-14]|uniref:phosphatase PAP2 family protein n=1 Tax=Paenibacillus radicibacter TaxID=2972488 RepID=UPI00215954A6|nr:phosphatase PAP2 family protein [Paenibacillus radicibacter]MCR8644591.1 phosphatase PAP2 family protein [Paenibacillus radicibacter]
MLLTKKNYLLLLAVACLLLVVFSFTDLQISKAIAIDANNLNAYSSFFYIYGEVPMVIILVIAGNIMMIAGVKGASLGKRILHFALSALFLVLGTWMNVLMLAERLELGESHTLFTIMNIVIIAVITIGAQVYGYNRFSSENIKYLLRMVYVSVLYACITLLLIEFIKTGWGRVRFRDLAPDHANFSPWYLIQGEDGKSFPSGHSANSFTIVAISLFAIRSMKWKKILFFGGFAWWLLTAVSRINASAHYASDVTAGFMISMSVLVFFYWLFNRGQQSSITKTSRKGVSV